MNRCKIIYEIDAEHFANFPNPIGEKSVSFVASLEDALFLYDIALKHLRKYATVIRVEEEEVFSESRGIIRELMAAGHRLVIANSNRENVMGDPIRLMDCQAELRAAVAAMREVIAKALEITKDDAP